MKQWMNFLLVMALPLVGGGILGKSRKKFDALSLAARAIRPMIFFLLLFTLPTASFIVFERTYLAALLLGLALLGGIWLLLFHLSPKEWSSYVFTKLYVNSALIVLWGLYVGLLVLGIGTLWQR